MVWMITTVPGHFSPLICVPPQCATKHASMLEVVVCVCSTWPNSNSKKLSWVLAIHSCLYLAIIGYFWVSKCLLYFGVFQLFFACKYSWWYEKCRLSKRLCRLKLADQKLADQNGIIFCSHCAFDQFAHSIQFEAKREFHIDLEAVALSWTFQLFPCASPFILPSTN